MIKLYILEGVTRNNITIDICSWSEEDYDISAKDWLSNNLEKLDKENYVDTPNGVVFFPRDFMIIRAKIKWIY
jgi:hypothetical protein